MTRTYYLAKGNYVFEVIETDHGSGLVSSTIFATARDEKAAAELSRAMNKWTEHSSST